MSSSSSPAQPCNGQGATVSCRDKVWGQPKAVPTAGLPTANIRGVQICKQSLRAGRAQASAVPWSAKASMGSWVSSSMLPTMASMSLSRAFGCCSSKAAWASSSSSSSCSASASTSLSPSNSDMSTFRPSSTSVSVPMSAFLVSSSSLSCKAARSQQVLQSLKMGWCRYQSTYTSASAGLAASA